MSSNDTEEEKFENNIENNEQSNNNKTKNVNQSDNESNKMENEGDYVNESSKLKINKKNKKRTEKGKIDFYDKEIIDDNTIYFANKLKDYNKSYKIILYISIIIYSIDIIISFKKEIISHNIISFFSTLIVLFSNIY